MIIDIKDFLVMLKQQGNAINSKIMNDLILSNRSLATEQSASFNKYNGYDLPIQARVFADTSKINTKMSNDYRGEIIDQIIGYLFGRRITYGIDKTAYKTGITTQGMATYNEVLYERDLKEFKEFLKRINVADLDVEAGRKSSIAGTCYRLCYIDNQGLERVMNIPPWECIIVDDESIDEVQFALRYYTVLDVPLNGRSKNRTRVEWYDMENITYYISDGGNFILDPNEPINPQPHLFSRVPISEFKNNEARQSDFVKVETIIDAYDRTLSDAQNEIEEFRQAYMAFTGVDIDKETIEKARKSGAFSIPAGGKIEYITKEINDQFLENHKKTLKDNIYRFSKTVDMSDEKFSGSGMSGEARKWKLLSLETKAATKELKFAKGLNNMFQVLSTSWQKKGLTLDWKNIVYLFDRNVPLELSQEADITMKLKGLISEKTRLSIFSPVKDVDAEIQQIKLEQEDNINLDEVKIEDADVSQDKPE